MYPGTKTMSGGPFPPTLCDRGVAAARVVDVSVHRAQGVIALPCWRQLSSTYRRSSLEEGTSHHATLPLYQELVKISFLPFLSPKS